MELLFEQAQQTITDWAQEVLAGQPIRAAISPVEADFEGVIVDHNGPFATAVEGDEIVLATLADSGCTGAEQATIEEQVQAWLRGGALCLSAARD